MAGVWADPFDYYSTAQIARVYNAMGSGTKAIGSYGPGGLSALRMSGLLQDEVLRLGMTWVSGNVAIAEFDLRISAYPSIANRFLAILDGTNYVDGECQVELHLETDGTISANRGHLTTAVSLGAASSYVLPLNTFVHFSVKFVVHPTAGSVIVDVYPVGSTTPTSVLALTGVNTRITGTSQWNGFVLGAACDGTNDFARVMLFDGSGTRNNDRIGPIYAVASRRPTADGAQTSSTPLIGRAGATIVMDVVTS